jgi:hypothetical protein
MIISQNYNTISSDRSTFLFFPELAEDKEIAEVKYRDEIDLIDHYLKRLKMKHSRFRSES